MEILLDSADEPIVFTEGASGDIVAQFHDMLGADVNEAAILTLVLTLYDKASLQVINSRNEQNVKDVNGGTVATNGELTMRLNPIDNVIVGSNTTEEHIARFKWTWNDGTETRTGIEEILFSVTNLPTVIP